MGGRMPTLISHAAIAAVLLCPLAATAAKAAEEAPVATAPVPTSTDENRVQEVVIFGRGEAKIGVAHAASEGTISGADMLVRPLLKPAELVEAVPGMIAAQHSGSGKANQYFLRGFNLDHGTDFTTYVDDVQMNLRTHGHGQGYLDLNGLIPELINREDFRKGPYRADGGDFALAGALYMTTLDAFDRPFVAVEGGSYEYARLAAGGTLQDVGGGRLTLVGEGKVYDGPWQEGEHLRHYAAFAKYARDVSAGHLELTAQGYKGTWRPTEQIPERIIGSAVCADVFCSPDPSAIGETTRVITNAKLSGEGWKANVYAQYYDWDMFSNPTYANADGSSAQIHQSDRRMVYGLRAEKTWAITPKLQVHAGTENRYDDIDKVGVTQTDARQFVSSFGLFKVKEASAAAYGEVSWEALEGLRVIGGLRADYYHADVAALDAVAATLGQGKAGDSVVSPKIDVAYKVDDHLELYADWGRGFHSNDVRGQFAATPVPILVKGTGKEAGARLQFGRLTLTTTYWTLNVGSELRFVGDSNAVEPTGASRRRGYELVGFWRPFDWLAIDGNYSASHARYDNGDHIPNAFENSASFGVSYVSDAWRASARLRHLGPSPLIEDNSVRDHGSTVVNLRGARAFAKVEIYGELLNVFDSRDKDIAYYYESYIPSFDAEPTDGRLSRVVEPRTVRIGATYRF